jgi:hypothetical protein
LNVVNLALFVSGAAGPGILIGLMLQRDKDMRRIAALDLWCGLNSAMNPKGRHGCRLFLRFRVSSRKN